MPITDLPELLTVEEFQRTARIGRSAAYKLVEQGRIPTLRFGRMIRIPRTVFEKK